MRIFSVHTCELNHRYEWVVEICEQVVCAKSTERPKIRTCFQSSPAAVSCNAPRIGIETRTSGDVGTFRHMIIVACVAWAVWVVWAALSSVDTVVAILSDYCDTVRSGLGRFPKPTQSKLSSQLEIRLGWGKASWVSVNQSINFETVTLTLTLDSDIADQWILVWSTQHASYSLH